MSNERLINHIRGRIFELRQQLNKERDREKILSIKEAINNNQTWLVTLGVKLKGDEVVEV